MTTIITLKETALTGDNTFQVELSFDHDTSYPLTITRPPAPSESDLEAIPNTLSETENAFLQWR